MISMELPCIQSLIIILLLPMSFSLSTLRNEDLKWILSNANGSIEVPAKVPGGVYGNLMKAGFFKNGDFYFRYNDLNYRWVSYENWTFSAEFEVPESLFNETKVAIEFDGLDTIATISIDGHEIGSAYNMFSRYVFDIDYLLKRNHSHKLSVQFGSPVEWAKDRFLEQILDYEIPPRCVDPAFRGECHANYIRKMQASFGWDWGPAFPDMGIWRSWNIIGWKSVKIASVLFWVEPLNSLGASCTSSGWRVFIKVYFESAQRNLSIDGNIKVKLLEKIYVDRNITSTASNFSFVYRDNFEVPEGTVNIWWPNGYGLQPLYNLTVEWAGNDVAETTSKTIRIGFRTIELDQSVVDTENVEFGRHFRIKVNNVTIFMKGSNWIPAHVLPDRVSDDYAKQLLQDAAKTHQNCLRVWGGGVYESDLFYEVADELGILIWQDFMFACSMYPSRPEFLKRVQSEIETQVKRLQFHPSIMLWAGNNENEAALRGNWYGTISNFTLYKADYVKLYVDTIRPLTLDIDESRPFVVSSPSNGIESEEEGFVAKNPYSNSYGDVHFYDYGKDGWSWKTYPRTRFASEYGFQSWPSYTTMKKVMTESDLKMNSPMMGHRQHHPFGNLQLLMQISKHFRTEECFNYDLRSFKIYLYLVQVHQAMAVKTETEFYRRGMSSIDANGFGYTSGALYWQLNDIWPGASWSSIEYGGRWKMLHHYADKFFTPVLLSPYLEDKMVRVQVANDLMKDLRNVTLTIRLMSFLQIGPLNVIRKDINIIHALSSGLIATFKLQEDLRIDYDCFTLMFDPNNICYLSFDLTTTDDSFKPQESFLFLSKPKYFTLKNATVQIKNITSDVSNRFFEITLQTDFPALFVWMETEVEGVLSDNGFLLDNRTKTLIFEARQNTTKEELLHSFNITSLSDTYDTNSENTNLNYYANDLMKILKLF